MARGMKFLLCSATMLLWVSLAGGADLQTVVSALRAQDYGQALTLAKELTEKDPSDARAWTLAGMANEGLKNPADALHDYRSALRTKPDYLPALKAEAQLEYLAGDQVAAQTLEHVIKLEPADQISHAMLAALDYKRGSCKSAVTQYGQSLEVIANKPDALTQYGECLLTLEQPDEAAAVLTKVVGLEPDQWWSRYNLASAEMSRKQPGEAAKELEPVLNAPVVRPQVLDLAARAYEASGDTPQAVSLLRRAILLEPDNESYYLHFTDLCFDHASFQVGVDMLDAGLTRLPNSARLYLARGILWGQLGDSTRAENDFDRADRLTANGAISAAAASLIELQNSNLDKALQLARTKLKTNPRDPMLHYVKAETLKQMGVAPGTLEFREAVDSASVAVRLKPDFVAARDLLGALYMQENRPQLAREQFDAVLKQDPDEQTALYHLIQLSRKSGRNEEVPGLMKRLSQARVTQQQKDRAAARYRLVEPQMPGGGH